MALEDKLYNNLRQDLAQLSRKNDPELDSCRLPKSDDITSFNGCVENIPTFKSDSELQQLQRLVDSLVDVPVDSVQEMQECIQRLISCCNVIRQGQATHKDFYTPIYDFVFFLASFVTYETIQEKTKDTQVPFKWMTLSDGRLYLADVPRIRAYYRSDKRRKSPLHDAILRLLIETVYNKKYKQHQPLRETLITQEWVKAFDISEKDVPQDPSDADVSRLILLRLSTSFFPSVRSFLRKIYVRVEQNYRRFQSTPDLIYDGVAEIVERYLERDANKNLQKTIPIKAIERLKQPERRTYVEELSKNICRSFTRLVESLDGFDFEQKKYEIVLSMSSVSCYQKTTETAQESDEQYKSDTHKDISTDASSYDFTTPSYWLRWTAYLNLVSILPLHWCVGLITPVGTPVQLPVVYVHLKTITFGGCTLVVFLSVCGLAISPSILLIDGHGGIKSTWLMLFRGGNVLIEQNEGSVSVPTGFVLPQSVNENVATFDTKPELTALAPMLQDAYPPFDRMRLSNPAFLRFLNSCCTKARLFQGLIPL